ncbi:spermatogenesis-associated protein 16 [Pipra filicauda]|uniref:Spermatogenesis-associated protein 16 n=1 Tax=Pipra filicauda TaxID=649802 RepID=A0A6J2GYE2_9PASS|nr:spermatogenesis-associated protein 16 [Pipra filicauda]
MLEMSPMIADCTFITMGGTAYATRDLIRLYWQAKIDSPMRKEAIFQEAFKREISFLAMYKPFVKGDESAKIKEADKTFAKKHPDYMQHIFTDQKAPFSPTMDEEAKRLGESSEKKIMPEMDFIRNTRMSIRFLSGV